MSSLKFSVSIESYEAKKFNFSVNSSPLCDPCSTSSFSSYLRKNGACMSNPFSKLMFIKVSRLESELSHHSESIEIDDDICSSSKRLPNEQNPSSSYGIQSSQRNLWKRLRSGKEARRKKSNPGFSSDSTVHVDLSDIAPDLSLESCNSILKRLERQSDGESLRFFEWMRVNGKLKQNVTAYNLILRVLSRREDWDAAERTIQEMITVSSCAHDCRVFNTLIYGCSKRGLVKLATKWFNMMLQNRVPPNIATIGMLMSLYQKGCNLEEAEFTFLQMRNYKLKCQSAYSSMITIYSRLSLYDKAEEVSALMREDKVVPNLENWLVLLNAYSQQGKLEEAESIMNSMEYAGFPPNIIAYNTLITGFGKISNMDSAQCLFQKLKTVGIEPDETTFRSMIEGWGRANNYREAERYYMELKMLGFKPNSSNLYTMLSLQAKHNDEECACKTIDDMIKIGCQYSSILSILLQAYERAGRIQMVPLILKGSLYEHVLVNQTSCSVLVMAYVKHCLVDDAIEILFEKRWRDSYFEDNLYHLLICSCKESGHYESAVKIYSHMPKPNEKPNLHITGTMIDIYSIMGQYSEAKDLYLKLKSSGIELDMILFSIVVRMYAKAGSVTDACSVLDTMDKQKNIVPDIYLFRDMLRIYQKCGMVDKLSDLYYKILKSGVDWDQEMYNCVINCCARALPVDELSRLYDGMLQRGFAPNTITFNIMLDVYGKSGLFKKAKKVFYTAKRRGLIDVISYNTIISAYGQGKRLKDMKSTVQKMEFSGFSVSLEAYNSMLDAYGKEGQMECFKSVLQRMKESNCASDNYTYNIMINIYGERGWIEEVTAVLEELRVCGLGPDLCSYNTLIKAYGIAGMVEEAVELMKEMRGKDIRPDKITYVNLINALKRNDKFLEAVKWSLWMKQMGL